MRRLPWPLALTLLGALYLGLRLPTLLALPLFNDEAVYLVRALHFPAMLFTWGLAGATFPDGKLLHELLLAALARLPADQLAAGRLLSVACGLGTALALAQMGRGLERAMAKDQGPKTNRADLVLGPWSLVQARTGIPAGTASLARAGLLAGVLYALAPLAAIHDVLAVPDSMLTLVSALVLRASLRLAVEPSSLIFRPWSPTLYEHLLRATRAGLAVGALVVVAALIKLPGLLLAATPLLAVAILPGSWGERWRRAPGALLAVVVAAGGYLVLRDLGYGLAERDKLAGAGLDAGLVWANLGLAAGWVLRYLPGVLLIAPLAALAWARHSPLEAQRLILFLVVAGLCYVASFVVVGQTLYSRYLLPAWPALLLAAAVGAGELWANGGWRRDLAAGCVGAALAWGAIFQGWLIAAPLGAPLAAGDRFQYIEGWPAGQGLDRLGADLRAAARARPGLIVVSGEEIRLGNLAARLALRGVPATRLELVDLGGEAAPTRVAALAREGPLVVVVDAETAATYGLGERFTGLREGRRYSHAPGESGFVIFVAGAPHEYFVYE